MPIVIGIAIRKTRDKILADAGHHDLHLEEKVVVETDHGLELGSVIECEKMVEKPQSKIFKVIRKGMPEDLTRAKENNARACQAVKKIKQCIENHELNMKLTFIEYSFDRSKLFIYYTAETRVDFRELIKDLGHLLKTRIQMVQIGVRDEARMIGGLGMCGRELCCRLFLQEFTPVSIEMAKEQDISLNTAKISGLCGRLMCCLSYEAKYYREVKKALPPLKSTVVIPQGKGTVIGMNCITREITVDLGEGNHVRVAEDQIQSVKRESGHNNRSKQSTKKS